jgi:hypothetical protein
MRVRVVQQEKTQNKNKRAVETISTYDLVRSLCLTLLFHRCSTNFVVCAPVLSELVQESDDRRHRASDH